MLYFITMKEMQGMPKPTTIPPINVFSPDNGKLYFAILISVHPSSSKPLQYQVFCRHVDANGFAIPNTPLYCFFGCGMGFFDEDTVLKIATFLHVFINQASYDTLWYEYESHSPPGIEFCVVRNLALPFKNYPKRIDVDVNGLGGEFVTKYSHQFKVTKENPAPPFRLIRGAQQFPSAAAVDEPKKRVQEDEKSDETLDTVAYKTPLRQTNFTDVEQVPAKKKRRQLQSMEPESLNFNTPAPTASEALDFNAAAQDASGNLTGRLEDSWDVPDGFFDGLDTMEPF